MVTSLSIPLSNIQHILFCLNVFILLEQTYILLYYYILLPILRIFHITCPSIRLPEVIRKTYLVYK